MKTKLLEKIKIYGHPRFIERLDLLTVELNNQIVEFPAELILKTIELTESERELFELEKTYVDPHIENQKISCIEKLLDDPNTRQAIIYNTPVSESSTVFPCISVIHFLTNTGTLNLTAFSRSSDVERLLNVDLYHLASILSDVAEKTKLKLGIVTMFISSAHYYE